MPAEHIEPPMDEAEDDCNLSESEFKAVMRAVVRGMPDASEKEWDAAMLPAVNQMISLKVAITWYCAVMNDYMHVRPEDAGTKEPLTFISIETLADITPDKLFEPLRVFLPDDDDDDDY